MASIVDPMPPRPNGPWLLSDGLEFAEGQLNAHLWTAFEALRQAIGVFDDCCDEGVNVPDPDDIANDGSRDSPYGHTQNA